MTSDSPNELVHDPPSTNSQQLRSLALDAYLAGYEEVAQNLTLLANRLNEETRHGRLGAIARIILTRAKIPGQGFDTLFDGLNLSELSGQKLPRASGCQGSD